LFFTTILIIVVFSLSLSTDHSSSRVAPKLGYLLIGLFAHDRELATGIVAMIEAHKTNPADVMKIHRSYSINCPTVNFLHNNSLLSMLLDDLFSVSIEIAPKHLDKYIYCLAYATSVSKVSVGLFVVVVVVIVVVVFELLLLLNCLFLHCLFVHCFFKKTITIHSSNQSFSL
jgi:hypothetical protein